MDYHIAQTISPDDPIKQIFDALDWQAIAKLKLPKNLKKAEKDTTSSPCSKPYS
ncbi:MAG: hypothetical protein ABIL46_09200 [candidate division WOR-3 bacterium]